MSIIRETTLLCSYTKVTNVDVRYIYIYISSDFLLSLNLRALNKLSLVHAAAVMFSICSAQLQESEKVRPKCL